MTNSENSRALSRSIGWLDSHINYERIGPQRQSGQSDKVHDPERRLRHLNRLMELMGEPQSLYPSFHLTGTNGKTSTSRIITSLVLAQGLSAGTYTSPHLQRLNERVSVNNEPIEDDDLAEVLASLELLEPLLGDDEHLSYFEVMTAAAFRHFADAPVDVGVIEVGIGGTWDATNVINAAVSVVTNIGLDHLGYLGPTRRDIAIHKAGIIKPGSTAVIGETDPAFMDLWEAREPEHLLLAERDFGIVENKVAIGGRLLSFRTPKATYEDVFLSLHGSYQASNAVAAVTAAEAFFDAPVAEDVLREALGGVSSPGRMEIVRRQPLCILDGAHNPAGATALMSTLDEEFSAVGSRILVIGMLRGHDYKELLPALQITKARLVITCTAPSERGIPAEDIARQVKASGVECRAVADVGDAVKEALAIAEDDELVLVTGSLYVVGAARTLLMQ